MCQIFNTGIGYILVIPQERVEETINRIQAFKLKAWQIGTIAKRAAENTEQIVIDFGENA